MADNFTAVMARLDELEARQAKAALAKAMEEAEYASSRLRVTASTEELRSFYGNLEQRLNELSIQQEAESI